MPILVVLLRERGKVGGVSRRESVVGGVMREEIMVGGVRRRGGRVLIELD